MRYCDFCVMPDSRPVREKYCRVLHTYLQETEIYHDFLVIHSISELYALFDSDQFES